MSITDNKNQGKDKAWSVVLFIRFLWELQSVHPRFITLEDGMKYNSKLIRALWSSTRNERIALATDFHYLYLEHIHGAKWSEIENKFILRTFLHDLGDWSYWGGTKITPADGQEIFTTRDKTWISKIQSCYECTANITNRQIFGKRYWKKFRYPLSIVFFEKGKNNKGKHIHCLHHFPNRTLDKADQYLSLFSQYWNDNDLNRFVGRDYWYEPVKDQDRATRYTSKKMHEQYEISWFPVF